jgi:DNA-binding response OmpR family regulator
MRWIVRLLLVEDNDRLALLTKLELERMGFAVDRAASVAEAEAAIRASRFDLMILDLGLPDGDGTSIIREIRMRRLPTPVLILTAREGLDDRVAGLDAGADDYLVKPFEVRELAARCRALLRRPAAPLSSCLTIDGLELDTSQRTVRAGEEVLPLGRREIALLESLLRRPGQVVPREVLEQAVYAGEEEVTPNALDALVSRLRRRLSQAGVDAVLRTVHGVGYMLSAARTG